MPDIVAPDASPGLQAQKTRLPHRNHQRNSKHHAGGGDETPEELFEIIMSIQTHSYLIKDVMSRKKSDPIYHPNPHLS